MKDYEIVVTGGAGFIGSHLTKSLKPDNEVTVLDNLSEGDEDCIPEDVEFHQLDIGDRSKVYNRIEAIDPDIIFHLAAYNDALGSIEDQDKAIKTNINGTVNLLEACKDIDVKKLVYASSGGLSYGEPNETPTMEQSPLEPVYPYGVSKTCGSLFIMDYGRRYGIEHAIMRLGSVYGPGANGGVIKNFLSKIGEGEQPVVYGDGSQTRDFVHVSDVVKGLIKAAQAGSGIYNLGTETQTSINQLLEEIDEITDAEVEPVYKKRWQGDIDRCELSNLRAREEIGWKPNIKLKEGLRQCRDYYIGGNDFY